MVIDERTSQINSFVKGMNSDGSYDQIEEGQYVLGLNIRITKNQPLTGHGDYSSLHEGIVTPIHEGVPVKWGMIGDPSGLKDQRILSVKSVDNLVVMVTTKGEDINVYRFYIDEDTNFVNQFKLIWRADNVIDPNTRLLSTVLYKELDNVIKFYIATGTTPIVSFRVDDSSIEKLYTEDSAGNITYISVDELINNRIVPESRIHIDNVTSGRLVASLIQYTYRYYNKYGNTTQLAPLTNKIQVIDPSRQKEAGNAESTETSIGFTISINVLNYKDRFDRLLIYRLQYIKPIEDAEVCLIYDGKIDISAGNKFVLNDTGIEPLQLISMEEFSAMSGIILVPLTIEQNQEYMFCGNVKDDTIIKDASLPDGYAGKSRKERAEIIKANVVLANRENVIGEVPYPYDGRYLNDDNTSGMYDTFVEESGYIYNQAAGTKYNTKISEYLEERGINAKLARVTYNNIFTSSLLRSLRRGETYKYAIVFYDKYGRRTDVLDLGSVKIDEMSQSNPTFFIDNHQNLVALAIGLQIKIPDLILSGDTDIQDIIGCLILRRSSSEVYLKSLLQIALSRPVQQSVVTSQVENWGAVTEDTLGKSPFYPTGLLTVNKYVFTPVPYYDPLHWDCDTNNKYEGPEPMWAKTKNSQLFLIFSSEINFRRNDVLSKLNVSDAKLVERRRVSALYARYENSTKADTYYNTSPDFVDYRNNDEAIHVDRNKMEPLSSDAKMANHWIFNYYQDMYTSPHSILNAAESIKLIKDVKIPNWEDGFSNVQKNEELDIVSAICKYKNFTTNIDKYPFNNWVSFGRYDLRPGSEMKPGYNDLGDSGTQELQEFLAQYEHYKNWMTHVKEDIHDQFHHYIRKGYAGPGGSCFVMVTENDNLTFPSNADIPYTSICNIEHTANITNVESDEYVQYYGFGNYFSLKYDETKQKLVTSTGNDYLTVFDGDVYITPHELTTMYKQYNFQSVDTLLSGQIVCYVPLESKVNTYFDYGMNMMNTQSANLLYEPGSVDGVTIQERPAHLYNMVYSDNDSSNDLFTLISTDKDETNYFKQRAYYSELKTNGEFIDNFLIFKPAAFIDVDSKYGLLTNLLTDKNTLYYWQDLAFGRFSVNERSLVNDQNSNTIMLGQAGILSRYDYISTKYGMRLYDFCARSVENGVYWVDINNKAIVASSNSEAINYGERVNIQNIINDRINGRLAPQVDYDLLNNEVLCKCFGNDQIVFNAKYGMATSIYTRVYDNIAYIKNHIYGLKIDDDTIDIKKYNYYKQIDIRNIGYLAPLKLDFVVNPMASVTKVFDSQQLVPIKRDQFPTPTHILFNTKLAFETDIVKKYFGDSMEPYTDREGNIIYNIPRYKNEPYGNRIRGKWLKVSIENSNPSEYFTISHIITKFRQSFS